jgi:hypothetical protein
MSNTRTSSKLPAYEWRRQFSLLSNAYLLALSAYEWAYKKDPNNCREQLQDVEAAADAITNSIVLKAEEIQNQK